MDINPENIELGKLYYTDLEYGSREAVLSAMRLAKDVETRGHNSKYKVGAVLFGQDNEGRTFFIAGVNTTPKPIVGVFGKDARIGDSHSTEHAETILLRAMPHNAAHASIAVTKNCCPTCLSTISEYNALPIEGRPRIEAIYGDSGSLSLSDDMSRAAINKHRIAVPMLESLSKHGGITYKYANPFAREGRGQIKHKFGPREPTDRSAVSENQILVIPQPDVGSYDEFQLDALLGQTLEMAKTTTLPDHKAAATLIAQDQSGQWVIVIAAASMPPGFQYQRDGKMLEYHGTHNKKSYKYVVSPVTRALAAASRLGLDASKGALISSYTPDCGIIINAVGAGVTHVYTNKGEHPVPRGHAIRMLSEKNILTHEKLTPVAAHINELEPHTFPHPGTTEDGQGYQSLG